MKTIAIIGAGQLGSRHLQGLLKYKTQQDIYVLDPSQDSLKVAHQRADEISHQHRLHFVADWTAIPQNIDLAIVATNSNVREAVVLRLLENFQVNFLVLEKVLFQSLGSFSRVGDLIEKKQIKTWVNHPRRMFESYHAIKQNLLEGTPRVYQVAGGNWGLACNALHFIDLFEYLSDSQVASLNASGIDNEILLSKRNGFIEFTGTVRGLLQDGSHFSITSFRGEPSAPTIVLFDAEDRFVIQEGGTPCIYRFSKQNAFEVQTASFLMEYQSTLTERLTYAILEQGVCELPSFSHARLAHEKFIIPLLDKYNQIQNTHSDILPIT